jgi:hypothetical protein
MEFPPLFEIELRQTGYAGDRAWPFRLLIAKNTHDNFQYTRFFSKKAPGF